MPSEDVAKAVGVEAWGDIAKTCVNAWLSARPSERAIDRTCAVEVVASNCGFVPPPSDGAASYAGGALGPLEAEAPATEMREAETRRAAVLARARELALSDDQTIVRTLGDAKTRGVGRGTGEETETSKGANNLLDGAPRTVSKATDLLAAHVDDVLQSATELDPHAHRASASLAAAAADCLDLFRACVIAARGEQLKTIHAASLVFYNDCHHLANRFSASAFARRHGLVVGDAEKENAGGGGSAYLESAREERELKEVSEEVDLRLRRMKTKGEFPARLTPEEMRALVDECRSEQGA